MPVKIILPILPIIFQSLHNVQDTYFPLHTRENLQIPQTRHYADTYNWHSSNPKHWTTTCASILHNTRPDYPQFQTSPNRKQGYKSLLTLQCQNDTHKTCHGLSISQHSVRPILWYAWHQRLYNRQDMDHIWFYLQNSTILLMKI